MGAVMLGFFAPSHYETLVGTNGQFMQGCATVPGQGLQHLEHGPRPSVNGLVWAKEENLGFASRACPGKPVLPPTEWHKLIRASISSTDLVGWLVGKGEVNQYTYYTYRSISARETC